MKYTISKNKEQREVLIYYAAAFRLQTQVGRILRYDNIEADFIIWKRGKYWLINELDSKSEISIGYIENQKEAIELAYNWLTDNLKRYDTTMKKVIESHKEMVLKETVIDERTTSFSKQLNK